MNIFWLDNDPVLAAQYQCDKHVVKMILESAQLLCTAHHIMDLPWQQPPERFYRATHQKHPCTLWVCKCIPNYWWLVDHAQALLKEYTYRYDKKHASTDVIRWCSNHLPNLNYRIHITPPAQAMPDTYKNEDPVQAYRDYYWYDKRVNIDMRWTRREKPEWWMQRLSELAETG